MRTIIPLAAVAVAGLAPATVGAQLPPEPKTRPPVRVGEFRDVAQHVYRYSHRGGDFHARPTIPAHAIDRLTALKDRARTRQGLHRMRRITRRRRDQWRWHRKIDIATPYGKWAIPSYIVYCESHGYWNAYNPSGASGPYQLLGWGAPMPVTSAWAMAQHHLIAGYVLRVQGLGAWVCA